MPIVMRCIWDVTHADVRDENSGEVTVLQFGDDLDHTVAGALVANSSDQQMLLRALVGKRVRVLVETDDVNLSWFDTEELRVYREPEAIDTRVTSNVTAMALLLSIASVIGAGVAVYLGSPSIATVLFGLAAFEFLGAIYLQKVAR